MKARRTTQPSVSNLVKFPVRRKSPASLNELLPDKIDLFTLLIPNQTTGALTYVSGDDADAGLCHDDLLVSDSSLTPAPGDIVLVHDGDGGLIVRRHERTPLRLATRGESPAPDEVLSVVTFCVRRVKGA
jgi:hypothetical protein